MKKILILSQKETQGFFDSLTAYILLVVFLGFGGFFTWLFGSTVFFLNQASLHVFFGISFWTLFFFIPALTMKSFSEEQRTGTLELLSTKSISDLELVLGKWLACLWLVIIALTCTLPYYVTVALLGNVDHGAVLGGYLGLILLSAAYTAMGIFTSSLTNNQIVAFLLSLCFGSLFQIIFGLMSEGLQGPIGSVAHFLSANVHFSAIRGVVDT